MGDIEFSTGDILVVEKLDTLTFVDPNQKWYQKDKTRVVIVPRDLPLLVVVLYGVEYVLLCEGGHTELTPLAHIKNEMIAVYRNWEFDTFGGEELLGEAIIGVHTTSSYENSVYRTIVQNSKNRPVSLVLDLFNILGVPIPIDTSSISPDFKMSAILDFNSRFYPVHLGM